MIHAESPMAALIDVSQPPYSARGSGAAGDGAILLAALAEAVSARIPLFIPAGTWLLDGQMSWAAGMLGYSGPPDRAAEAVIVGAGAERTILKLAATPNSGVVFESLSRLIFQGVTIDAWDQQAGSGVQLSNVEHFELRDLVIRGTYNNGILIADDCRFGSVSNFVIEDTRGVGFNGSTVESVGYGIALASSGSGGEGQGPKPQHIRISSGRMFNVFASGINVSEAIGVQISDVQIIHHGYRNGQPHLSEYAAISVKNNAQNVIISNVFGDGTAIGLLVIGAHEIVCDGCIFANTGQQGVLVRFKVESGLRPRHVSLNNVKVIEPGLRRDSGRSTGFMVLRADGTQFSGCRAMSVSGAMEHGFSVDVESIGTMLSDYSVEGASVADVAWLAAARRVAGSTPDP